MTLEETIDAVQKIHDQAAAEHPLPGRWTPENSKVYAEKLDAHHKSGEAAVARLVAELGATKGVKSWDGYKLHLAGVATSCTGGHWGLMTNWLAAARKKLNKEKTS